MYARPFQRAFAPALRLRGFRWSSSAYEEEIIDIRSRLKNELKVAMKAKNTVASTTIRSVLAEVLNADKASSAVPVKDATVYTLLRKSIARRTDAAAQFRAASRPDLAEKEEAEMSLLQTFLPPPLSETDIERYLSEAISKVKAEAQSSTKPTPPQALLGKALKTFWSSVPESSAGSIPGDVITKKAKDLLTLS